MYSKIRVLGIDPGFANVGYTLMDLTNDKEVIVGSGVIRTVKSYKKGRVRAADDNVRRTREISHSLLGLLATGTPEKVRVICAEAMSFPRNASNAAKMAMTWGVIVSFAELWQIPILQASPREIKMISCGTGAASKEQVEAAMLLRYPEMTDITANLGATLREHAFDSAGAIVACLNTDEIRMLRSIYEEKPVPS